MGPKIVSPKNIIFRPLIHYVLGLTFYKIIRKFFNNTVSVKSFERLVIYSCDKQTEWKACLQRTSLPWSKKLYSGTEYILLKYLELTSRQKKKWLIIQRIYVYKSLLTIYKTCNTSKYIETLTLSCIVHYILVWIQHQRIRQVDLPLIYSHIFKIL